MDSRRLKLVTFLVVGIAALVVVLLLVQRPPDDPCAGIAPPGLPTGDCNPGRCTVAIQVNQCAKDGIRAVPAVMRVRAANNMVFEIATPGYRFSGEGIFLPPDTKSRFIRGASTPTQIRIRNEANARECVKYDVEVVADGADRPCPRYDPHISNQ